MAKKKDKRLKVTKASDSKSTFPTDGALPPYEPFVIIKTPHDTRSFKVWFEKNDEHMVHSRKANIRICKGKTSKLWIVLERPNIPETLEKEVSRLFALWLKQELPSYSAITNAMSQVCHFMAFLDDNFPITKISEFSTKILIAFEKNIDKRASYFKPIFSLHPDIDWAQIHYALKKKRVLQKNTTDILIDEDSAFSVAEYSEREHFQMIAYAMHRVELIKNRRKEMFSVEAEPLKKVGCYLNDSYPSTYPCRKEFLEGRSAASRIRRLYDSDRQRAISLLHENMLIIVRDGTGGRTTMQSQINSLRQTQSKHGKNLFLDYMTYLEALYEPTNQSVSSINRQSHRNYKNLLLMKNPINEFALLLTIIIQTGINLEVALSLKRNYGKVHWTKRFDVNLGIDTKTIAKRKVLRLTGLKRKLV